MRALVGINHVALDVGSIDEALAFWERLFGPLELRGRSSRMAFVDLGDQFVALAASRSPSGGDHRHVGIVVSDREATLAAAREAGADVRGNDVRDPWGNVLQIVNYADVQFTKDAGVLAGMGLAGLGKRAEALAELRAKGLLS